MVSGQESVDTCWRMHKQCLRLNGSKNALEVLTTELKGVNIELKATEAALLRASWQVQERKVKLSCAQAQLELEVAEWAPRLCRRAGTPHCCN